MENQILKDMEKLSPKQKELIAKKAKLILMKKSLYHFIKYYFGVAKIHHESLKKACDDFETNNKPSMTLLNYRKDGKRIIIEKSKPKSIHGSKLGTLIIDDDFEPTTEKTQDELKSDWEFFSNLQIVPQPGSIVRWSKDDICGKMLSGELE